MYLRRKQKFTWYIFFIQGTRRRAYWKAHENLSRGKLISMQHLTLPKHSNYCTKHEKVKFTTQQSAQQDGRQL